MAILNLEIPIFQAGTGSVAGPALAAAVAQAGAMGGMGLTWTSPEDARAAVRCVKERTQGVFQANFALAFPPAALGGVLDEGIPCVTFSWGDPTPYVSDVRASGAQFGIQVTSVEGALRALDLRPDFLVCQGVEAGGHVQSSIPLERALPQVVEIARGVPVVAAGGIVDGRSMAGALKLGASAAMMGTRFVATRESLAHDDYKRALVDAQETALTVCFEGGWPNAPHRVLRNRTLREWEAYGCPPVGRRPGEGDEVGRSVRGEPIYRYEEIAPRQGMTGELLEMCLYAGDGVGKVRDIPSATELVERLWAECRQAMDEAGARA